MIDYPIDIKPLQDQGVSNSDIAAHLSNRTAFPMDANQTVYTLQDSGAVILSPVLVNQREGTLITYWQGLPEGAEKDLLAFFLSTVFNGDPVRTDQYPRSTQFALAELNMTSDLQLVAQTLVVQAGGRPDQGTTEADVVAIQQAWETAEAERIAREEAERAAAEAERIKQEQVMALNERYIIQYNANIAPLIDGQEVDELVWKAAIQKMADDFIPAE